jgi:hypothetical protein
MKYRENEDLVLSASLWLQSFPRYCRLFRARKKLRFNNPIWRTGIPSTEFPSGSGSGCTYSVTVVDGASNTIVVTSTGTAGGVSRYLTATLKYQ